MSVLAPTLARFRTHFRQRIRPGTIHSLPTTRCQTSQTVAPKIPPGQWFKGEGQRNAQLAGAETRSLVCPIPQRAPSAAKADSQGREAGISLASSAVTGPGRWLSAALSCHRVWSALVLAGTQHRPYTHRGYRAVMSVTAYQWTARTLHHQRDLNKVACASLVSLIHYPTGHGFQERKVPVVRCVARTARALTLVLCLPALPTTASDSPTHACCTSTTTTTARAIDLPHSHLVLLLIVELRSSITSMMNAITV